MVFVDDQDRILVGQVAADLALGNPGRSLRDLKSRLGQPAPIVLGGRPYRAIDLVAEVLRAVLAEAVRYYDSQPVETRLTHPATWSRARREALLEAANLAGLPRPQLIPEPVAAALTYVETVGVPAGSHVAVFDLGGGTFDTAVLRRTAEGFEVVGRPIGDGAIGGELFDEIVMNLVGEQLAPEAWDQLTASDDPAWRQSAARFRSDCKRAKEAVSAHEFGQLTISTPIGQSSARITRDDVEASVEVHIDEAVELLERCVAQAGIDGSELAAVFVAGGASRMPIAKRKLDAAFPDVRVSTQGDPKAAVAYGALLGSPGRATAGDAAASSTLVDAAQTPAVSTPAAQAPVAPQRPASTKRPAGAATTVEGLAGAPLAAPVDPARDRAATARSGGRARILAAAGVGVVMLVGLIGGLIWNSQRGASLESARSSTTAEPDPPQTTIASDPVEPSPSTSPAEGTEESAALDEPSVEPPIAPSLAGTTVTVFAIDRGDVDATAFQAALDEFAADNSMTINLERTRDIEGEIEARVGNGTTPDIGIYPGNKFLFGAARAGFLEPIPEAVAAQSDWSDPFVSLGLIDGVQQALPLRADPKSLIWYRPTAFEARGYDVPTTWDGFIALTAQMLANGDTPLCVGIESGAATGWVYTDWVEGLVLGLDGADVYDQWANHEIPFNDPRVVSHMESVIDLWSQPGAVFGGRESIASTNFGVIDPLLSDDCLMHRQAALYAGSIGPDQSFDLFAVPANTGQPLIVAGDMMTAFDDRPEVWAVIDYMGSAEFGDAFRRAQNELDGIFAPGFVSAADGIDVTLYDIYGAAMIDTMRSADVVRFDASDLMPAEVGLGSFWAQGAAIVTGEATPSEAAATVESTWPP